MNRQFDYFVSGEDIPGVVYHNINEKYGYQLRMKRLQYDLSTKIDIPATIADYLELNPGGDFHVDPVCGEIREYFEDDSYEVVARSGI